MPNIRIALGGGIGSPGVYATLSKVFGLPPSAWACDPADNSWQNTRYSRWVQGLSISDIRGIYQHARDFRYAGRPWVHATDLLLSGSGNLAQWMGDNDSPTGYVSDEPETGAGYNEGASALSPPWAHSSFCRDSDGNPHGDYRPPPSGPDFQPGPYDISYVAGEGAYQFAPLWVPGAGNVVGCPADELGPSFLSIIAGGARAFTLPDWIRQTADGTTFDAALSRMLINAPVLHKWSYAGTVDGGGVLHTSMTITTEPAHMTIMVLGKRVSASGDVIWETVGMAAGETYTDGKWKIADGGGLVSALLSARSRYRYFAFMPSTVAGFVGATDFRGALNGMMPAYTLDYYTDPSNSTATFFKYCNDFNYIASAQGEWVTWDDFEFGDIIVQGVHWPDSMQARRLMPGQMPPMTD